MGVRVKVSRKLAAAVGTIIDHFATWAAFGNQADDDYWKPFRRWQTAERRNDIWPWSCQAVLPLCYGGHPSPQGTFEIDSSCVRSRLVQQTLCYASPIDLDLLILQRQPMPLRSFRLSMAHLPRGPLVGAVGGMCRRQWIPSSPTIPWDPLWPNRAPCRMRAFHRLHSATM